MQDHQPGCEHRHRFAHKPEDRHAYRSVQNESPIAYSTYRKLCAVLYARPRMLPPTMACTSRTSQRTFKVYNMTHANHRANPPPVPTEIAAGDT
eukprot:5596647-Pleurochrysis_carterae.AAC.1